MHKRFLFNHFVVGIASFFIPRVAPGVNNMRSFQDQTQIEIFCSFRLDPNGWPDVPGVGISFGAERIYDVLEAKDLFPQHVKTGPKILLVAFDDISHQYACKAVTQIRRAGIASHMG